MRIWDFYTANHTSKLASISKLAFARLIFSSLESLTVTSDTSFCVNILGCLFTILLPEVPFNCIGRYLLASPNNLATFVLFFCGMSSKAQS